MTFGSDSMADIGYFMPAEAKSAVPRSRGEIASRALLAGEVGGDVGVKEKFEL